MNRYKNVILILSLCVLLTGFVKAEDASDSNDEAVTIALTKFDVNETTLELGWKITNNTDHDIWICKGFCSDTTSNTCPEYYMAEDDETLMIRRRLDLPSYGIWSIEPSCSYIRLRRGEKRSESLLLNIPVDVFCSGVFDGYRTDADHASRLVMEIGYYDEHLPGLIRGIINMAEKFDGVGRGAGWRDNEIACRYFPGLIVNEYLGDPSGFDFISRSEAYGLDTNEQIIVSYTYQALKGEKILRLEINDFFIPVIY
jgi:hypothetical protein